MGYLVYCPTCGGKMSNNARTCPHCGETAFFDYDEHVVRYKEKCEYNNNGKYSTCWKGTVYVRDLLLSPHVQLHFADEEDRLDYDSDWVLVRLPGRRLIVAINKQFVGYRSVVAELQAGRFECHTWGNVTNKSYHLFYRPMTCPHCNGKGYVIEERVERGEYYDIRERVK